MPPNDLPQMLDTLLRLPRLDTARLRELVRGLPDPRASALEMMHRGWITQDQYLSLFPDTPMTTPTEALAAESEDWDLPLSEGETTGGARRVFAGAAPVAGGHDGDTDRVVRQWMRWGGIGLLVATFGLVSLLVGLSFRGGSANPSPPADALRSPIVNVNVNPGYNAYPRQPVMAVDLSDLAQAVNNQYAKVCQALQYNPPPNAQPAAPAAPAKANDAKFQAPASSGDRANPFPAGQAVSVESAGRWWDARVLKSENERWYVSYDGFDSTSDEWVSATRIRPLAPAAGPVAPPPPTVRRDVELPPPAQQPRPLVRIYQ